MPETALLQEAPRRKTKRASDSSKAKHKPAAKAKGKPKAEPMSLRMDNHTRSLIDRAATVLGQNRTEFMLTSARERATEVLLNQRFFGLPLSEWEAFSAVLDNPPPPNAKLKALLAKKAPWED